MAERKVRVRFAPSPTGPLHIGGVRTALYNYLFAKQHGGDLVFRIEDTDSNRFVPGAEEYILESFKWLGIKFDEGVSFGGEHGPYRQSERKDIYKKYVKILLDNDKAYIAFDTPEELNKKREEIENFQYDAKTRGMMRNSLTMSKEEVDSLISAGEQYVVRFKIEPGRDVHVDDMIRGDVKINSSILDDKVLYITWINETLSKDEYNGKISTFKENLSDDITRKTKDIIGSDSWKGSCAEVTLNALRRHVRGEGFQHNWGNDVLSSIAAVVVRGDDWQKLLEYMQSKEMTEYQIAFSMYGTLNGFANLPRNFTDVLFSQKNTYVAAVYKEFYGQLFCRDIISVKDDTSGTNANETPALEEDKPEEVYNSAQSQIDRDFDNFMRELTVKCAGAKKDKTLYESFYKRHGGVTIGFVEDVKKCTAFCKGKGVQKGVINYLNKLVKPSKTVKPSSTRANIFSETSTGNFLTDFDFLVNNTQFSHMMNSVDPREWENDLKWFIDAHEPLHKDYHYYSDKDTDNNTLILQFTRLKNRKYRVVEEFLRNLYCK